jgi:RimJ/RimL family protein N-acetyltransferase
VPAGSEGGWDYVVAETDAENWGSRRVLEKSGFQLVEELTANFDSPMLGLRDTIIYKIARPGCVLEGKGNEEEFVPPVQ